MTNIEDIIKYITIFLFTLLLCAELICYFLLGPPSSDPAKDSDEEVKEIK